MGMYQTELVIIPENWAGTGVSQQKKGELLKL